MNTRFRKALTAALAAADRVKVKARVAKVIEERLTATIANPESETATRLLQTFEKRNLDGFEFSYSSEDEWEFKDDTTAEPAKRARMKAATQTSATDSSAKSTLPLRTNRTKVTRVSGDPPTGIQQGEEYRTSSEGERGFDDDTTVEPAKRPRVAAELDRDSETIASLPSVATVTQEYDPAELMAQPLPTSETATGSYERRQSKVFDVEVGSIDNAYD
jgi:hypothetical protein